MVGYQMYGVANTWHSAIEVWNQFEMVWQTCVKYKDTNTVLLHSTLDFLQAYWPWLSQYIIAVKMKMGYQYLKSLNQNFEYCPWTKYQYCTVCKSQKQHLHSAAKSLSNFCMSRIIKWVESANTSFFSICCKNLKFWLKKSVSNIQNQISCLVLTLNNAPPHPELAGQAMKTTLTIKFMPFVIQIA